LVPEAEARAHAGAQDPILNWCHTLRCLLNTELLLQSSQHWAIVRTQAMNTGTTTEKVIEPELVPKAWRELEKAWLPAAGVTAGKLLVAADAHWRTVNLRERTLVGAEEADGQT